MDTVPPTPLKIAVVGSGIAGLTAAFLLARAGHHVEIFEREFELGMDAHGVSGLMESEPETRVDVPLRVFSRTYYPNLVHLYKLLGVEIRDADYSFSCSKFTRDEKPVPPCAPAEKAAPVEASVGSGVIGGDGVGAGNGAGNGHGAGEARQGEAQAGEAEGGGEDEGRFGYARYGWLPLPTIGAYFSRAGATAGCVEEAPGSASPSSSSSSGPTNGSSGRRGWRDGNLGLLSQLVGLLWGAQAHVEELNRRAGAAAGAHVDLATYLTAKGYSEAFMKELLFPMLSVVCTCSYDSVGRYPANVALDYLAQHGVFNPPWRKSCQCRVIGGVRKVARALAKDVARVRLGVRVTAVRPGRKGETNPTNKTKPSVEFFEGSSSKGGEEGSKEAAKRAAEFDHVILATQAHQALGLLEGGKDSTKDSAPTALAAALATFRYEKSRVVVHRDLRLMPTGRRLWSPLNILVSPTAPMPMCTVWMSKIDQRVDKQVLQTWNPLLEPEAATVAADATFERPVVTVQSAAAMTCLESEQGKGGVWLVGAYALLAVPLLENGVKSAVKVAGAIGAPCPWPTCIDEEAEMKMMKKKKRARDLSVVLGRCLGGLAAGGLAAAAVGLAIGYAKKRP